MPASLVRSRPLLVALTLLAGSASAQPRLPVSRPAPEIVKRPLVLPPATVEVTIGFAQIEVRTDQPLTSARGGLVPVAIKYTGGGSVAALQIPGSVSYPIGPFSGSFEHAIKSADVRAILKRDEAQILGRCRSSLAANRADDVKTVHDAQIPVTVTSADGAALASTTVTYQLGLLCKAPPPPLTATIGYAKLGFVVGEPLASAAGGLVDVNVRYNGSEGVASFQVPGSGSYPLGARTGSFEHTIKAADLRSLLRRDEAQISARCAASLDASSAPTVTTVHDTQIPVTVNAASGAVVASTSVAYQLGLECKRALTATLGYAKIVVDVQKPLSAAAGGLVPFAVAYNGSGAVASVQVPGSVSMPVGARTGPFQHTVANADVRAILKRDEAAILDRCKRSLDAARATSVDTVHDTRIPVTVNAASGAAVASTSVSYQLGLTCKRAL